MNQPTLLRYNFHILMHNNWMLLAFPAVVSQLSVFWFVLTQRFSPELPAQSVEMVTPLLAAFLGAHLLSTEYRSRVGAVLASRPVNINRIVVLRLVVMLALVWLLAGLSLMAYSLWMQPFDISLPVLACIPSTLFLSLLALTFATLFRNSLAGFGVAALYWALDLVPGPPLNPYLSLHSLTSYYGAQSSGVHRTFLDTWWQTKIVLLIGALALYLIHARMVFALGTSHTLRARRRAALGAATVLGIYLFSGMALRMVYGYTHLGKLPQNDITWFRYQFSSYGSLPASALFGPTFHRYLGEFPNPWRLNAGSFDDMMGNTVQHRRDLMELLNNAPNSVWAPSAADALARIQTNAQSTPEEIVTAYRNVVNRYPKSPYIDYALRQIAHAYADAQRSAEAQAGYEELLLRVPHSDYQAEAYSYLMERDRQTGNLPEAARRAEQWISVALIQDRFDAWKNLAEIRNAMGDKAGAKQAAQETLTAAKDFERALQNGQVQLSPSQELIKKGAAQQAQQEARRMLL